ncbi:MAG TPA: ribosome silencing factor [Clostridiales bacterium]|nr:ribosome silencing factor [Clostridiales bacterium]
MANSRELALLAAKILHNKKADDIVLLDVSALTIITDYFVICSGKSFLQVKALQNELESKLSEHGYTQLRKEGHNEGRWVVMDYGDVVVHIFHQDDRQFYDLERLWTGAQSIHIDM